MLFKRLNKAEGFFKVAFEKTIVIPMGWIMKSLHIDG